VLSLSGELDVRLPDRTQLRSAKPHGQSEIARLVGDSLTAFQLLGLVAEDKGKARLTPGQPPRRRRTSLSCADSDDTGACFESKRRNDTAIGQLGALVLRLVCRTQRGQAAKQDRVSSDALMVFPPLGCWASGAGTDEAEVKGAAETEDIARRGARSWLG
jgi:hypothetical protein